MKKLFIGVIILAAIAAITNPNLEAHKEAVTREFVSKEKQESIGGKLGKAVSDLLVNQVITRKNNYIYSETRLKTLTGEKTVGYGFFGFVLINKDEITKSL